jgi:hypothetical protein
LAAATLGRFVEACVRSEDELYLLSLRRLVEVVNSTTELGQVFNEIITEGQLCEPPPIWWTP